MQVHVEIYGSLRAYAKNYNGPITLELPEGSTVGDAAKAMGITEKDEWNASVRGKFASSKVVIFDGDRLLLFDAIGGG
jgi:hypothetical protein